MAASRYELMININGNNVLLDTYNIGKDGSISIPLNYQINDISDIATKNSSYSKSINIPDSKDNRAAFEYVFSINSDSTFDVTVKSECWVLLDTVIQFHGYLQLVEIDYDYQNNNIIYVCIIYGDVSNIFTDIGERFLQDLDLSVYDHHFSDFNIINSWSKDYTNGYVYPLFDYSGEMGQFVTSPIGNTFPTNIKLNYSDLNILDFKTAIYAKTIFDKIISEAGYTYESYTLNSDPFTKCIIPFNNPTLINGVTPYILSTHLSGDNPSIDTLVLAGINPGSNNLLTTKDISGYIFGDYYYNSYSCFTNTVTSNNSQGTGFDTNNFYDNSNYWYQEPVLISPFIKTFKINVTFGLSFSGPTGAFSPWSNASEAITICLKRSYDASGNTASNWGTSPTFPNLEAPPASGAYPYIPIFTPGTSSSAEILLRPTVFSYPTSGPFVGYALFQQNIESLPLSGTAGFPDEPLRPGEQVQAFFRRGGFTYSVEPPITVAQTVFIVKQDSLNTVPNWTNIYGLTISNLLPNNIKQKDFVSSILKIFNLYVEPDKYINNHLRIESRDRYFQKYQVIKDWSQKLDLTMAIKSTMVSNTQKRVNLFAYTPDKDFYNSLYTSNTNKIYGQEEYDIINDFITDQTNITPIFSPTPIDLLPNTNGMFLPININNNNGKTSVWSGMNMRLLYFNNLPVPNGDAFTFEGTTYSTYPFCGPFDDPTTPTVSLNYGPVAAFDNPNFQDTTNNLFGYYSEMMTEVSDKNNRIITAYFNLTSLDISQFYFSDVIFCRIGAEEGYYRVNKIIDYDPALEQSTCVELIKAYQVYL